MIWTTYGQANTLQAFAFAAVAGIAAPAARLAAICRIAMVMSSSENTGCRQSARGDEMATEPDYDAEMRLPAGKTCDDCVHSRRCFAFGFSEAGRTSCDFWPNKFAADKDAEISLGDAETSAIIAER